jgi:hypothetical protein
MGHHRLKAAAGASPADPYFSSTSLLLLGNGTNGGQNNTFVDSSANNFTITRNGNTTQGSFSPFSAPDGRWSNYFDGSGDYLSVSSNAAFGFGTGSFTVEFWIYPTTTLVTKTIYHGTTASSFIVNTSASGQIVVREYGVQDLFTTSAALTNNVWNHVAVSRSGSTLSVWINGSRANGATGTNSTNFTTTALYIGDADSGSRSISGYLSNIRVVKGTDIYGVSNATISVPVAPLQLVTNTSLLTCQSNRFIDNSTNAFTVTPSGNAAVTSFSPFAPLAEYSASSNGGSGYFDGNGDYLSTANNGALDFGSGDFTVECWFYRIASSNADEALVFFSGSSSAYAGFRLASTYLLMSTNGSTWLFADAVWSINNNSWNHLAVTRSGSTVRVFLNGSIVVTKTISGSLYSSGTQYFVGLYQFSSTNYFYAGNLSSLRILKGTAQYTATFTPPTSPLTAITNTSLLLNFTNASIIDSTSKNDLETVGDAQISTSVTKFGTGSLKFDGTGDYLSVPASTGFQFGTGDFTIEFWVYTNSTSAGTQFVNLNSNLEFIIGTNDGNNLEYYTNNYTRINSGTNLTNSVWNHIACSRASGTTRLYLNGTQVGTSYSDGGSYSSTNGIIIGKRSDSSLSVNGYLDDLRITKGVARYTSNFTPPSAQLPSR